MKNKESHLKNLVLIFGSIFLIVMLTLYAWNILERHSDIFNNVNWDMAIGWFIFIGIPGLLTIMGILWLIGFLFKIDKKLDD